MLKHLGAAALLAVLCLPASVRAAPRSASPLVSAFAERGWVFALRADGSVKRLTAGTAAVDPLLSPDRGRVAYFSTARGRTDRYGRPVLTGVWMVGTRANPQTLVAPLRGAGSAAAAWSPGGRRLAYARESALAIWSGQGAPRTIVVKTGRGFALGPVVAWSPDGRRVAVPLAPLGPKRPPRVLTVAVAGAGGGSARLIRVRFPAGMLGSGTTAFGSHPDSSQLGWSAGGQKLLVATTTNGAGNSLTSIWRVSDQGGTARLLVGSRAGLALRGRVPALDNATHFLLSPDRGRLATDPGSRFWVAAADGTGRRFLAPHPALGCVIAQYSWLAGSRGLAYVTLCPVPGSARFRSSLYTIRLRDGRRRLVVTATGPGMNQLSLAPAFRCVACG